MVQQIFSATRTHATFKPRVAEGDIPFYRCQKCGNIFQGVAGNKKAFFSGTSRSKTAELPYASLSCVPTCCGGEMERLIAIEAEDAPEGVHLDYKLVGGFNSNAVRFVWDIADTDRYVLEWVALKSFTGYQMKYVTPGKRSPIVFANADEDAFAYCDKDPCHECMFICKRGFIFYCFIEGLGLVRVPIMKADSYNPA
ncbi:MAG: hypothetical protein RR997_00300 [Raoultibacter sp.]